MSLASIARFIVVGPPQTKSQRLRWSLLVEGWGEPFERMYRWRWGSISDRRRFRVFNERGRHSSIKGRWLVDALLRRGKATPRRRLKLSANLLHVAGIKATLIPHASIPIPKQKCKADVRLASGGVRGGEGGSLGVVGSHPCQGLMSLSLGGVDCHYT